MNAYTYIHIYIETRRKIDICAYVQTQSLTHKYAFIFKRRPSAWTKSSKPCRKDHKTEGILSLLSLSLLSSQFDFFGDVGLQFCILEGAVFWFNRRIFGR